MHPKHHKSLLDWYQKYGRHDLPWRNTDDPYKIYLSEVMLQQTQVKTVIERFYFPFLERFPTLEALAKADLDEVLKMWEGLGYYTRAKNLHKSAKSAAPTLPDTYEALLALSGIGQNTASAICVFAYKQKRAVMEANVRRVLCRIHAIKTPNESQLRTLAHEMLDLQNPYDYNQAMMDIGAMVCTVRAPKCHECPLRPMCKAFKEAHFDYPMKKSKSIPMRQVTILIRHEGQKLFLKQREGAFLHGLWGFETADEVEDAHYLADVTQSYTHFKLSAKLYIKEEADSEDRFFSLDEIAQIALSSVDKKILQCFKTHIRTI